MRYSKLTIFIFISVIILGSCNQKNTNSKIGILLPYLGNSRWTIEGPYMQEKILELGGEAIIKSAESNESMQYAQALELIEQGVDAIVIVAVNVNTAAAIVRVAHDNGIKVIGYDRLIRNCDLDFFISFDGEKVGELIANYAMDMIPEGNYVLLNGDKGDENAVIFYNGTMKVLQPAVDNKKINIVYTGFIEGWLSENAAYYTDLILEFSNTPINAIISQYDGLSEGVVEVLKQRGLNKKIILTGQDALLSACHRIVNGEQTMTVYKPPKKLAYRCAELVYELHANKRIDDLKFTNNGRKDVPTILLEPVTVDKNNLNSTVVADGLYTMDEIENNKQ